MKDKNPEIRKEAEIMVNDMRMHYLMLRQVANPYGPALGSPAQEEQYKQLQHFAKQGVKVRLK